MATNGRRSNQPQKIRSKCSLKANTWRNFACDQVLLALHYRIPGGKLRMRKSLRHVAFSWLVAAVPLAAQNVPAVHKGAQEIAAFVGASYGIDDFRAMGGGNYAYAVTREIMPYAEFSYFPGIGRTFAAPLGSSGNVNYQYSVPLSDFHGGIHFRIPLGERHIVPYLSVGVGAIHTYSETANAIVKFADGSHGTAPVNVPSATVAAGNFGGGIRFYIRSEKFGVRLEAKAYKAGDTTLAGTVNHTDVFGKVTFGLFYQIR